MTLEQLQDEEEALRQQIRQLSDSQRKAYYRLESKRLKDPDTYAVLNYFFIAGLHHFYLGNQRRGIFNLAIMIFGLLMLPLFAPAGVVLLIAIFVWELPQLFKSQQIVYAYNNQVMRDALAEVQQER